jgi:acetolactate synthase-1/2/3 large subunit
MSGKLTGADILVECLKEQGVDTIFGYPGGYVLNIYDSLYNHTDEIKHYRTSHEQGAVHAADGYARATGKAGVCLATSGPGATNLVTGIATAYMDSVPLVSITGNVSLPQLGKDSFQEVDITGVTMPISKHNFIVKNVNDLAETVRQAFYIAKEGRPGPVHIDIVKDVMINSAYYCYKPPRQIERRARHITPDALERAAAMINESRRPLIYAGGGVISSGASEELFALAQAVNAPVALSSMGLGAFPGSHDNFMGMLGMHGTAAANYAAMECDLLIAAGVRFSDRAVGNSHRFATKAKIIHLDIDPAELGKNVPVTHYIIGDVKESISGLLPCIHNNAAENLSVEQFDGIPVNEDRAALINERLAWLNTVKTKKAEQPPSYTRDDLLRPQFVIETVGRVFPDGIIVTEVGQHQMWACHFIQYNSPRTFISSGGLGTMGFGLGAAIGARIGNPGKRVINIAGDGCFRMNSIELATAVDYKIPIIEVIINNHTLGMVRQWQTMFYDKHYAATDIGRNIDYARLAEVYGCAAYTVTRPDEIEPALRDAAKQNRPAVINCEVGTDDCVFPMVPPGKGIDEVLFDLC